MLQTPLYNAIADLLLLSPGYCKPFLIRALKLLKGNAADWYGSSTIYTKIQAVPSLNAIEILVPAFEEIILQPGHRKKFGNRTVTH